MARSYDQFCPAARALDVVGGRWTLLVVRELAMGPRRYSDLLKGLPGIGPNVLAERLAAMREHGLVRKSKAPVHGATVYELTDVGDGLRPVVDELSHWGMRLLDAPRPGEHVKLDWLLGCIRATFRPELAAGLDESYQFCVDGEFFHLVVRDSTIEARHGTAEQPAFTIDTDLTTFLAVGSRTITLSDAQAGGFGTFSGDPDAAERAIAIIGPHFESATSSNGLLGAVGARFDPQAVPGLRAQYEFRLGGEVFHARVENAEIEVALGPAEEPDVVLSGDLVAFLRLASGGLTVANAIESGKLSLTGDTTAAVHLAAAFGLLMN